MPLSANTAVGSISASSNQLILVADGGFQVGDSIIVEIGGETGAGLRGTVGVGGTWPALSYANTAAMNADTGQVAATYAWTQDSGGDVWLWSPSWAPNTWTAPDPNLYYTNKVSPRALLATISAMSGDRRTLTLSRSAVAASTNANVYFDNAAAFASLFANSASNVTVPIPAGVFATSARLLVSQKTGWTVAGAGESLTTILSPKGTQGANLDFFQCTGCIVRDLHLQGNARFNGYGIATVSGNDLGAGIGGYAPGVIFDLSTGCSAQDLTITDVFLKAVGTSFSTDCNAYRCDCVLTDGLQTYVQWMFQWADSTGGDVVDCSVTSPILTAGFETFRSTGVSFIRPVGVNATCSANSSGNFLFDSALITIRSMSQYSSLSFSEHNPIINVNSNIQPPSATTVLGGTILNPTIIQEGYINANNDSLLAIVINSNNPNITIEAIPPWTARTADFPHSSGYIEAPDYRAPSLLRGAEAVNSTGRNTVINGLRAVGAGVPGWGNLKIAADDGSGSIVNCVADSVIPGVREFGNVTNAWFLARIQGGGQTPIQSDLTDLAGAALTDLGGATVIDLSTALPLNPLTDLAGAVLTDLSGATLTDLSTRPLLIDPAYIVQYPAPVRMVQYPTH